MTYRGFKDLPWRSASNKALRDKAFNIAKVSEYGGCQHAITQMVCKFTCR